MLQRVAKNLERNALTALLVAGLALYWWTAFREGELPDLRDHWTRAALELRLLGGVAARVETKVAKEHEPQRKGDFNSLHLGGLGYLMRYYAGQIPQWVVEIARQPREVLIVAEELPFQVPSGLETLRENYADVTRELVSTLSAKGVTTVVLPVPTKLAFLRTPPDEVPYTVYRGVLEAAPRNTVDLHRIYRDHLAAHPESVLYYPADSHWTTLGIALAAQGVLEKLRELGVRTAIPEPRLLERKLTRERDLLAVLQLPAFFADTSPRFQWEEPMYALDPRSAKPAPGRLVVAGSSYSGIHRDTRFGLGQQLAGVLGRELVNSSKDGGAASGGLDKLRTESFRFRRGDVLIWEFPVRLPLSITTTKEKFIETVRGLAP